jgi:glycosyltransferase involved in cell wall biosynthesis
MARVLLVSPYHGGSHRAFAEGLVQHSGHRIDLETLPARFWKWRMRGAALRLAPRIRSRRTRWDVVLATDMLNLAEFRSLSGLGDRPHVLYMHESQLDYPLSPRDRPDRHYGFINLASALAADRVVFNSRDHRDRFLGGLPALWSALPDCPLPDPRPALRRRSRVLPVGVEMEPLRRAAERAPRDGGPPVVLWNHRWDHDKDPETFFAVLDRLAGDHRTPFRLAVAGAAGKEAPPVFGEARLRHRDRLVHFGTASGQDSYGRLLGRADIVVSTARQENFGLAVVEAVACGAWPLLPRRLAYPEVLPRAWHDECLYDGPDDLARRLAGLLADGMPSSERRHRLARAMDRHAWPALIGSYDDLLAGMAREHA